MINKHNWQKTVLAFVSAVVNPIHAIGL